MRRIDLITVDFPLPDSPTRPKISFSLICMEKSLTACIDAPSER